MEFVEFCELIRNVLSVDKLSKEHLNIASRTQTQATLHWIAGAHCFFLH